MNMPPNYGRIAILKEISVGRLFKTVLATCSTKKIVLKTAVDASSMSRELLRREYEISKTISHPNIVDTLSFEEETPVGPAIVMEYIDGVTLSEYVSSARSRKRRYSILNDILSAVEYLHKKGIFHNDIKPDNIIVNNNGTARLIDFGLAISDDSLYKGVRGGTDGFSSPEILKGEGPCGAASDIYSLGKIMALLFPGKAFRSVVKKCAHHSPTERFNSVGSFRRAILLRRFLPLIIAMVMMLLAGIWFVTYNFRDVEESIEAVQEQIVKEVEEREQSERVFREQKTSAESGLRATFQRVVADMKRQKYMEFCGLIRGDYYLAYMKLEQEAANQEKPALQAVFAEHMLVIDSILTSLPSITSLPPEEQAPLIEMVNAGQIQ